MAQALKDPPANVGDIRDMNLIPVLGRSPGTGHGNILQYSCLENPMDRGAWWATVHRVSKSWKQLKQFSTHTWKICCMKYHIYIASLTPNSKQTHVHKKHIYQSMHTNKHM